jgi:hypothetical protein
MDPRALADLLDQAAERGARRALERVGLHDENAGRDINELRTLIDGWRQTKQTIAVTIAKYMTISLLSLLALGAYTNFKGK